MQSATTYEKDFEVLSGERHNKTAETRVDAGAGWQLPNGITASTNASGRPASGRSAQQTSTSSSPFLCPGSVTAVSRSIHLARLSSAWPVCDQCELRHDTEGLAETTIRFTEQIRDHRVTGIQRSEYGVRAQYLNELDRQTASELIRVFCFCLHDAGTAAALAERTQQAAGQKNAGQRAAESFVKDSESFRIRQSSASGDTAANDVPTEKIRLGPVVIGYDGRTSSPDIFVGVTSAAREFGLNVVDIGRCTAASIQEAARFIEGCAGAIHVTGSGSPASWTGLDVANQAGDPVPVVWKDFDIGLQHVSTQDTSLGESMPPQSQQPQISGPLNRHYESSSRMSEFLNSMRDSRSGDSMFSGGPARDPVHAARGQLSSDLFNTTNGLYSRSRSSYLRLLLPDRSQRGRWLSRMSRTSGTHQVLNFEPVYRTWLSRWYPEQCALKILVRSDDALIHDRVAWLAEQTQMDLLVRPVHDNSHLPSIAMTMTIEEDDRGFAVADQSGRHISPERLAGLINVAIQSQSSLVTAHADSASGRFWLADTSRRESRHLTEHVRDSLAALGLMAKLIHTGRIHLG